MKKLCLRGLACIAVLCLLSLSVTPGLGEESAISADLGYRVSEREATGESDSVIRYPEFESDDPADAALIDRINQTIQSAARIPEYLGLLSAIQPGGTGLRLTYDISNDGRLMDQQLRSLPYVSILFSAEGKMLQGPPSQAYYPLTLDVTTGEPVPFDALFTDPEGAKAFMEACVETEIEPNLSTYLENNQLFPLPYDRYFLDGFGSLILVYDHSQLSFLSGFSGAVAFRYSELWDWLDTSPDGVSMRTLWGAGSDFTAQYVPDPGKTSQLIEQNVERGFMPGLRNLLVPALGTPLDDALYTLRAAGDSDYYPGGACYEVEEPTLRDALLLTDENETTLTGILASRVDCFGIETGKTTLEDAIALMSREPDARMIFDESTAEGYRVCPGTMARYIYPAAPVLATDAPSVRFSLYADDAGIVQYLGISLE